MPENWTFGVHSIPVSISVVCPYCGNSYLHDLTRDPYIGDFEFNKKIDMSIDCQYCEEKMTVRAIINITVEHEEVAIKDED